MSSGLPDGWRLQPLREVARVISGGTPSRYVHEFWREGTVPWVTPTDITGTTGRYLSETREQITESGLRSCSAMLLPPGSLLMTSRATIGEIRIAAREVCTNQGFKSLVPTNGTDGDFLYYQMLRSKERYQSFGIGSTFVEVNKRDTERFEVPLAPLEEQRRIAAILSTVDEAIAHTEALIAKTQQLKAGLMHDLFTRGVTPDGRLRPPRDEAPRLYKESPLGWIPKEWGTVRLDQIGDVRLGRQRSPKYDRGINTRPYLRVMNVYDDRLDLRDVHVMDFAPMDFERYRLRSGDVLLTEGDLVSAHNVGRSAVYRGEIEDCCFQNTLLRFRPAEPEYADFYHFAFCHSRRIGRFARETTATTVHHLSSGRLANVWVPFPDSPSERLALADNIRSVEGSIDCQQRAKDKLSAAKHGLMHDLLTGRVRVPVAEVMEGAPCV